MILKSLGLLRPDCRILNIAPERFMLEYGSKIFKENYFPADYNPDLFLKWSKDVKKIDLCDIHYPFENNFFDVVMHNHVLEHVPCNVSSVLKRINSLVKKDGFHIFSIPVTHKKNSDEDLSSNLTKKERIDRFGQDDHMRLFGELDFFQTLKNAMSGNNYIDISSLFDHKELEVASIPTSVLNTFNSHRVFIWRK